MIYCEQDNVDEVFERIKTGSSQRTHLVSVRCEQTISVVCGKPVTGVLCCAVLCCAALCCAVQGHVLVLSWFRCP
jgi:hypothetical protein